MQKKNTVKNVMYAEHTDDPKTWASPMPDFDLAGFNKELERRCGTIGSLPRFRCVWAGHHEEYLLEEFDVHTGWVYKDSEGREQFVSANDGDFEFPDKCFPAPAFDTQKYFIPRWAIEEFDGTEPFYRKLFVIEKAVKIGEQSGRIDVLSHYRPPAEDVIQALEHLAYLRQTLTPADIAAGLARLDHAEALATAERQREFENEIAEETAKALTDGLPNAKSFSFNPKHVFDIKQYSKNLLKEHNSKI